ncbi:MAG TPA: hypothetical protein VF981_17860 [Gemmatimonadaceae bacterium]
MLIDLMDSLRCPASHEESGLVLGVDQWQGSQVMGGRLGCPVCHAEYPIRNGQVDFTGGTRGDAPAVSLSTPEPVPAEAVVRLAAQLDLREPGGIVVLTGRYAPLGGPLSSLVAVNCVVLNATGDNGPGVSALRVADALPFALRSLRAAAIAGPAPTVEVERVVRALRAGARIVAPIELARPPGVDEIARDAVEWVGAVSERSSPPVPLTRRRSDRP